MQLITTLTNLSIKKNNLSERNSFRHPHRFASARGELKLDYEPDSGIVWQTFAPVRRPCVTETLLQDLALVNDWLGGLEVDEEGRDSRPRYLVTTSKASGIFNLGGDLELFAKLSREKDRARLLSYAQACINTLYHNFMQPPLPVVTIALVQGDALGGGFEAALAHHFIIAEKGTKLGLPEIVFSLFPGMGAYSFLTRRLGRAQAEKLISKGTLLTAEELYDLGVVHLLAEPGQGKSTLRKYLLSEGGRYHTLRAMAEAARITSPVSKKELMSVTRIWVDLALTLGPTALGRMERLAKRQNRKLLAAQEETAPPVDLGVTA